MGFQPKRSIGEGKHLHRKTLSTLCQSVSVRARHSPSKEQKKEKNQLPKIELRFLRWEGAENQVKS